MIDHLSTYTNDCDAAKKFYDAAFVPLVYTLQSEFVAEWNTDLPEQRMGTFGSDGNNVKAVGPLPE